MKSNEIPAPTAQPAKACEWTNCPTRVGDVCCFDRLDRIAKGAAQPVQQPGWCEGCDPDICPGCGPAAPAQRQPVQQLGAEAVTLADVLDALNCFNRPKPNEDDGPWEGGHYIRVDHLPAFINVIAAAWFSPAQRQPLTVPALTDAQMSECAWGYVADSRNLDAGVTGIIQATQLACAAAWGITLAQTGEKL